MNLCFLHVSQMTFFSSSYLVRSAGAVLLEHGLLIREVLTSLILLRVYVSLPIMLSFLLCCQHLLSFPLSFLSVFLPLRSLQQVFGVLTRPRLSFFPSPIFPNRIQLT